MRRAIVRININFFKSVSDVILKWISVFGFIKLPIIAEKSKKKRKESGNTELSNLDSSFETFML